MRMQLLRRNRDKLWESNRSWSLLITRKGWNRYGLSDWKNDPEKNSGYLPG